MRVVAERPEPVQPAVSVVVTLYDEAATVDELYRRVAETLDAEGKPWELILVDDGSADGTWAAVERLHEADARVRGVRFRRNAGQHPAMHAGLSRARGDIVVTMDGDLQNPPEEIPKLVAAVEAGSDVASGRRVGRADSAGRTVPSRMINGLLRRFTGVPISDFGCAFNAYRRTTLEPLLGAIGRQKFTKALVVASGATVVEVDVDHAAREGASKYSPLRLLRLALHVVVGFWPQPIQWLGVALGLVCAFVATALGIYGVVFWIDNSNFPGPLFLGVLVLYVLAMQGFVLALVGEYLSRIQRRRRGAAALHRREGAVGQRPRTSASASSTARSSLASRRPADGPRRPGSTTVVCSTRTRVSVPSSMIGGRKLAGRALVDVGDTITVLRARNSSA